MKRSALFPLALLVLPTLASLFPPRAQALPRSLAFSGHVVEAPVLWKPITIAPGAAEEEWRLDNQLLARQRLRWYPTRDLSFGVDVTEDVFAGPSAEDLSTAADLYAYRRPWLDLEERVVEEEHITATLAVDRLWADFYHGPFQLRLGRQRIAWGTALVWNPLDLFNPSSPLDFFNEQKPGTDAARLQVYTSPTTKLELAVEAADRLEEVTAAAQAVLHAGEYDLHLVGGHRSGETVGGGAWAGNIEGAGFRGEILGLWPDSVSAGGTELLAVLSADYTFKSTLYLHGELLYSSRGTPGDAGGLQLLAALQRGWLTPARMNLFGEVGRELTPLLRGNLMALLNPYDGSWFAGPSATWSVLTNLDLTGALYLFGGESGTEYGDNEPLAMARLKWSF